MLPLELRQFYATLEVPISATLPEVRASYRQLALMWHPDKTAYLPHCQEKIREINWALTEIEAYYSAPREYLSKLKRQARARAQGRKLRARWDHKCGRTFRSKLAHCEQQFLDATDLVLNPMENFVHGIYSGLTCSRTLFSYCLGMILMISTLGTMGMPVDLLTSNKWSQSSVYLDKARRESRAAMTVISRNLSRMEKHCERAIEKVRSVVSG